MQSLLLIPVFPRLNQNILWTHNSNCQKLHNYKVPLYWGIAADGYVAFADDADLLKGSCGKSLASFPQGCFYFTEIGGLKCYENPKNKIIAVPAEEEEIRGVFFKNILSICLEQRIIDQSQQ
ncbi:hypothetical protein JHK87_024919 [Glycine soja]|nr:hypothetical protein JHK87_024919 [Glycine soja]